MATTKEAVLTLVKTISGKILKRDLNYRAPEFQMQVLGGLQFKQQYQGTADRKAIEKRRAKNKIAKQSRKRNRA